MTLSDFKAKLNWRLILVHLLAFWFVAHAFSVLSVFQDIPLYTAALHHEDIIHFGATRISYAAFWGATIEQVGILTAFITSLIITRYRHWYWLNSLFAYVLAYFLCRFDFAWHYLKIIFLTLGDLFHTLMWKLIINGSVMLAIGLLLLFLNGVARFIDGRKQADEV